MEYERPYSTETQMVDLCGCKNPFCRHRIRVVPTGEPPPKHCGVVTELFSTLTLKHWKDICAKNEAMILKIRARIDAEKIRKERREL